ncbi:MAG TPA: hypothetical protein VL101_10385, partial [Nordella sp.]|nr:hypothetical protein [Nordella sp.]
KLRSEDVKFGANSRLAGTAGWEQNWPMEMRDIESCLPPKLHNFSRQVLEFYLHGHMTTEEFRRWFHMPNSDYLMLGDCIAQKVDPHYIPEAKLPPSITLRPNTF